MIFVDTGFFVALLCVNDTHHERAKRALQDYQGLSLREALLTTNNVVLETLTVARREAGHAVAVRAGELLFSGKLVTVHRTTEEDELAAFEYMRQHSDKRYSAIDCLSFVVMLKLGIGEALTFDRRDFSHRFIVKPDLEQRVGEPCSRPLFAQAGSLSGGSPGAAPVKRGRSRLSEHLPTCSLLRPGAWDLLESGPDWGGLNTYRYSFGDSVNFTDASGLNPQGIPWVNPCDILTDERAQRATLLWSGTTFRGSNSGIRLSA